MVWPWGCSRSWQYATFFGRMFLCFLFFFSHNRYSAAEKTESIWDDAARQRGPQAATRWSGAKNPTFSVNFCPRVDPCRQGSFGGEKGVEEKKRKSGLYVGGRFLCWHSSTIEFVVNFYCDISYVFVVNNISDEYIEPRFVFFLLQRKSCKLKVGHGNKTWRIDLLGIYSLHYFILAVVLFW